MTMQYRRERLDRAIKARCEDIFALSSHRELMYLLLPRALPILALLVFPLLKDIVGLYWEKVLIFTCVISFLAVSWDLLASAGLMSLGQALFFGVGAYLAGFLNRSLHWPPFLTLPIASVGGAVLCTLILIPVLRLRGMYFALLTLVLPLMFARIIEATKILGGTEGMSSLSPIGSIWVELYLPVVTLLVCLFGFRRLIDKDYGLVIRALRDNDQAVMAGGINIYSRKAQVVFIAGLPGAFAGVFLTHYYQFVGMPAFAFDYSIFPVACAVLGGVGTFVGPVLGAFILVPFSEFLRTFGQLRVVFYSAILMICFIGLPEGIFHFLGRKYHQYERLAEVK